ncbi:MAG: four-carbon acid sugar kinase family protein [bacterium]
MTLKSKTIGIIADDLTGANDTALQFHLKGCNIQILLDYTIEPSGKSNTQAWSISTETRNKPAKEACEVVTDATQKLINNFNAEYIYKKIDSTLRGNVAKETLAVLNTMKGDAAVIVPAFPAEGRTTVGGYHLLKGVPLERTEVARDPHSPIFQSHIPTLLKQQADNDEIIGHIQLITVMKGAGPVLLELNRLVKEGKKLIVVDAVSTTDMEQIALAIEKSNYNLLPCGSAGLAQVLTKSWLPDTKYQHIPKVIPKLPVLIVSGSMASLSKTQIKKLAESDEFDSYVLELSLEDVLLEPSEELVKRILEHLETEKIVAVHINVSDEDEEEKLKELGMEKEKISRIITDYLANLSNKVIKKQNLIFLTIGGETSYKCCNAIGSKQLQLIDEVEPAIPLCLDLDAQWIVTKSGNFGMPNTLVSILKYFKQHQP